MGSLFAHLLRKWTRRGEEKWLLRSECAGLTGTECEMYE